MNPETMTQSVPVLSLCIPTYNRADVLEATLEAFFADPDYDPAKVEVVVSDNCSTDCTPQVVARYPAVRYFRNEENVRDINFSRVLLHGRGEYVKLMNDTVRLLPGTLRTWVEAIEANRDSGEALFFYERSHRARPRTIRCRTVAQFMLTTSFRVTWIGNFGAWRRDLDIVADTAAADTQLLQVGWSYRMADRHPVQIRLAHYADVAHVAGATRGGYNLFRVFVENYLGCCKPYLRAGKLTRMQYERVKFKLFNGYFVRRAVWLLCRSERIASYDNREAWRILLRHYGWHPYFYLWMLFFSLGHLLRRKR